MCICEYESGGHRATRGCHIPQAGVLDMSVWNQTKVPRAVHILICWAISPAPSFRSRKHVEFGSAVKHLCMSEALDSISSMTGKKKCYLKQQAAFEIKLAPLMIEWAKDWKSTEGQFLTFTLRPYYHHILLEDHQFKVHINSPLCFWQDLHWGGGWPGGWLEGTICS